AADSINLECTVEVKPPVYFSKGEVSALVTMTSGSYTNYQTIVIAFDITTPNVYATLASNLPYSFSAAHTRSSVTLWSAGKSSTKNIVMHGTTVDSSLADAATCIYGSSPLLAHVGTASGRIQRTANAGGSWTPISIASIGDKAYSINFYDNTNGLLIA